MKKLFMALGVLLGLFVIAAIVVPMVVDVDKYRPQIVEAANQQLNGSLQLGKLSLSLWGQIRIEVAGVKLEDSAGHEILSVQDAYFHLPFTSVLAGRPTLTFKMKEPTINVVKNKAGKLNVMALMKPSAPRTQAATSSPTSLKLPAIVAAARLGVDFSNASISYKDETSGLKSHLENLNLILKDISLTHPMELEFWSDIDTKMGKTLNIHGPARLTAKVTPVLAGTQFDHADIVAKVDLDRLEIVSGSLFEKGSDVPAHADLSVTVSPDEANLKQMEIVFFNADVKANGSVGHAVHFQFASNDIDFKPWVKLVPLLKEYELGGSASLKGEADGPSDKLAYRANLAVHDLTAKAGKLKAEPHINAEIDVVTDQINNLSLSMKAPGNDLEIHGKVISFAKPHAEIQVTSSGLDLDQLMDFKTEPASGGASSASENSSASSASAPKADYDAMLDPLRENKTAMDSYATIGVNIKTLKAREVRMDDVTAKMSFGGPNLTAALEQFGLKLWGGTIGASLATQLKPKAPTYQFNFKMANLDLAQAMKSQYKIFKNTLLGVASFQLSGAGESFNPDPATKNLSARGQMKIVNATFTTIDVGKMAAGALNHGLESVAQKIPQVRGKSVSSPNRSSTYSLVASDFTISGGNFSAPDFEAKAAPNEGIDLKGATTVGLKDYALDANWEVVDTYNLTHARDISVDQAGVSVPHLLAKGNNPVQFPVHVGCSCFKPCYSYTSVPEALATVAANTIADAVGGRLKHAVSQQVQNQVQKLVPPSAAAPVQNAVQNLSKKFGF